MQPLDVQIERSENPRKMIVHQDMVTPIKLRRQITCSCVYGDTLYLGTRNSKVLVYRMNIEQAFKLVEEGSFYPHCDIVAHVEACQQYIVVTPFQEKDSLLRVWSAETLQILHAYKGHKKHISKVLFLKSERPEHIELSMNNDSNESSRIDLKLTNMLNKSNGQQEWHVASGSNDGTVRVWKVGESSKEVLECKLYQSVLPILEIKSFKQMLLIGGDDCYITLWHWEKQETIFRKYAHSGSVLYMQLFGSILFTAGGDGLMKLWQVAQVARTPLAQMINPQGIFGNHELRPGKVFKKKFGQEMFGLVTGHRELLLVDNKGNMFAYRNDEVQDLIFRINYTLSIKGISSFENYIIMVMSNGLLQISQLKATCNEEVNPDESEQGNYLFVAERSREQLMPAQAPKNRKASWAEVITNFIPLSVQPADKTDRD